VGKILTSALKADIAGSLEKSGFSNNLHDVLSWAPFSLWPAYSLVTQN